MKLILLILSIFVVNNKLSSQIKVEEINFRKVIFELDSLSPCKRGIHFSYKRIFISDSVFKEHNLFINTNNNKKLTTDTFMKKKNNDWYVKIKSKWKQFCVKGVGCVINLKIDGINYRTKWQSLNNELSKENIYKLVLTPINTSVSGLPSYIFSAKHGIIAIDGNEEFFIREDICNQYFSIFKSVYFQY